jgi:hypothetical protein
MSLITGPWRVLRTSSETGSPSRTAMRSRRVSKGR